MARLDDPGVRPLLEEQVDHAVIRVPGPAACQVRPSGEQRTDVLEATRVRHQKQR